MRFSLKNIKTVANSLPQQNFVHTTAEAFCMPPQVFLNELSFSPSLVTRCKQNAFTNLLHFADQSACQSARSL
jgi:hypothetical protein